VFSVLAMYEDYSHSRRVDGSENDLRVESRKLNLHDYVCILVRLDGGGRYFKKIRWAF